MSVAFSLRADHVEDYLGGVLAVGNSSVDVKAALDQGDGVIVVPDTDHQLVAILDDYPPLKRVPVPEEPAAVVDPLEDLSVAELRNQAKSAGVDKTGGLSKDELVAAIRAAEGDITIHQEN